MLAATDRSVSRIAAIDARTRKIVMQAWWLIPNFSGSSPSGVVIADSDPGITLDIICIGHYTKPKDMRRSRFKVELCEVWGIAGPLPIRKSSALAAYIAERLEPMVGCPVQRQGVVAALSLYTRRADV